MHTNTNYILIALLVAHLVIGWRTQVLIFRLRLTPFQKFIHTLLNWGIPFLWAFVLKTLFKAPKNPVTIKKHRKRGMGGEAGNSVAGSEYGGSEY